MDVINDDVHTIRTDKTRLALALGGFYVSTQYISTSLVTHMDEDEGAGEEYTFLLLRHVVFFGAQILGGIVGGVCGDYFGRKKPFLIFLWGLTITAIIGTPLPRFLQVVITPFLGFFGVGLYPLCGALAAESISAKHRHVFMALFFVCQGIAAIMIPLIIVLKRSDSHFSTIMAIIVVPCILLSLLSFHCLNNSPASELCRSRENRDLKQFTKEELKTAIINYNGCFIPWAIFDFIFYGTFLFNFLWIHQGMSRKDREFTILGTQSIILIGPMVMVYVSYRLTSKLLQVIGFVICAFVFFGLFISVLSIHVERNKTNHLWDIMGYLTMFRMFLCAPNLTTFVCPLELAPTKRRCTVHGCSVAFGRLGALAGLMVSTFINVEVLTFMCSFASFVGAATSLVLTPMTQLNKELGFTFEQPLLGPLGHTVHSTVDLFGGSRESRATDPMRSLPLSTGTMTRPTIGTRPTIETRPTIGSKDNLIPRHANGSVTEATTSVRPPSSLGPTKDGTVGEES